MRLEPAWTTSTVGAARRGYERSGGSAYEHQDGQAGFGTALVVSEHGRLRWSAQLSWEAFWLTPTGHC
jgi:hypothetical protein